MCARPDEGGVLGADFLVAGDSEVRKLPASVVAQDIGWLEVTVEDPGGVKILQPGGDVGHHGDGLRLAHGDCDDCQGITGAGHDEEQGVAVVGCV